MAWLERHEPWIDWKSKTLGATHYSPGGALVSHEPTSGRKQKRYWREHWTETVAVLDIEVSELVDTPHQVDMGTEQDLLPRHHGTHPEDAGGAALIPLTGTRGLEHEATLVVEDNKAGEMPESHEGEHLDDGCGVQCEPLSVEGTEARKELNEGIIPECDKSIASKSSRKRTTSMKRRQRRQALAVRRLAFGSNPLGPRVLSDSAPRDSETLYTLVDGVTGEKDGNIRVTDLPTLDGLLELDEMSFSEFGDALRAGKEYQNVVSKDPPTGLPPDRGVRHEIDLVPGTKYGVTKQWPLPKEQCDVIDAFFRAKNAAGMGRLHYLSCSRLGRWLLPMAHARAGHSANSGKHSERYALGVACDAPKALERASDVQSSCDAVVPSHRAYAQTYFDDIFVHSRAEHGRSDVDSHIDHLRAVLECFIGKRGLRADRAKVKAIVDWPVPLNPKDLRKWLGLANYLHKYSTNDAEMARPLSNLGFWGSEEQDASKAVKDSLLHAPILALPDPGRPFSVVCDASDFAIGSALLLDDAEGRERVVASDSRQLKAAEKNYPVHDNELLAVKYALVKFRVHLLGSKPFVIYTDHASLRTATQSPHLSQMMARWLSFFAEYNLEVKYKPGRQNALADALSRRPDYELAQVTTVTSSLTKQICAAYAKAILCIALLQALESEGHGLQPAKLSARMRARLHRYSLEDGLLLYRTGPDDQPRVVVPHDEDLKYRIHYEAHDTPYGGHLGCEKTYSSVSSLCWWPKLYK
ncbi:unnamed protein product [Phytophthora lilii]|uniref:Unnamed protein product n=1 Tax=Phytophthora lilii TaxID=2077276 RepID=A0A9W6WZW3_9STRA|nr:unnamed protein product [Phytophthora lilii]